MASFKNRIEVPKIKQPSLPISTILWQDLVIRVSHAPCMSHGIIEVLLQYPDACIGDKGHAYST